MRFAIVENGRTHISEASGEPLSGYDCYTQKELTDMLYNADPTCDHEIVCGDNWSGIKCSKCHGWYCA